MKERACEGALSERRDVGGGRLCARKNTHLDDVGMMQFAEVLDLPHGRHVEAILELAHLDLLDSDLTTRRKLPAWKE